MERAVVKNEKLESFKLEGLKLESLATLIVTLSQQGSKLGLGLFYRVVKLCLKKFLLNQIKWFRDSCT